MSARPTSWPAPVAFEDATCIHDLCGRIRDPDGAIYALRLWHHRRRCGATIAGDNATGTLESICRWRRKRGQLVEALVGAGLVVVEADGSLTIRSWEDAAFVDWTRSGGDDQATDEAESGESAEDAKERRRRRDRERKAANYAAEKARKDAETDAEDAENSPTFSAPTAENPPHLSAEKAEKGASRASSTRATVTGTGTATETEAKELPAADATGHAPGLLVEVEKPTPPAKPDPTEAAVTEVLEHWRDRVWVPTDGDPKVNIEGPKSEGRRKLIRPLLREGWTVERLKRVVDGAASDDWLMGRAPGAKQGGWTEVENVFRRSRLDAREKAATAPAPVRRRDNGPTPAGAFDALWGDPAGTEGVHP